MIRGHVTASGDAVVRVTLIDKGETKHHFDAVIDTGFNGQLTLPPSAVSDLELPWLTRSRAVLADGSETLFDVYEATIEWHGESRRILIDVADTEPLLGMRLLWGFRLSLNAIADGDVTIGPVG